MTGITGEAFRHALSHLPTGVTVVTAYGEDGPTGMAANSVTSVSLNPPLILFCPGKDSTTWPVIRASGRFCVNVMAAHHEEVTRRFARRGVNRFENIEHVHRQAGPGLPDAVAWIECELRVEHDAGDHTIAVADVVALETAPEAVPLVFHRGRYGPFIPSGCTEAQPEALRNRPRSAAARR